MSWVTALLGLGVLVLVGVCIWLLRSLIGFFGPFDPTKR